MSIHHLNCGPLNPPSRRLSEGRGSYFRRGEAVCHCVLIETDDGLTLIDTGLSENEILHPFRALGPDVALLLSPTADRRSTARSEVQRLGFDVADVRNIYMTHLDVDHRGGLSDFPDAAVHVSSIELHTATEPRRMMDRRRYRGNWTDHPHWVAHERTGEHWFGLPVIHESDTSSGRIVMVELPGHSLGHSGIAVQTTGGDRTGERWLFHVGDAIQHRHELNSDSEVPWGIRAFNSLMQADSSSRLRTRSLLRELSLNPEIDIICAHDPEMLHRAQASTKGTT